MKLVDAKGQPTSAQETLKKADARPGDTRDNQYNPAKINTKDTRRGTYQIVYLVYAPEIPGGNAQINIELPNKKQFKRVRRQMFLRMTRLFFINKYGEPQSVNLKNPYLMSATLEKTELSAHSKIEMPSEDFKVNKN